MILRRLAAAVIDLFLASVVATSLFGAAVALLGKVPSLEGFQWIMLFGLVIWMLLFSLLLALPTAFWGTTPGKWLFRLEVLGPHNQRLPFLRALFREFAKLFFLMMPFGIIVCVVIMIINDGVTLHDMLAGSRVEPRVKLTEAQKHFRETVQRYKDQR